MPQPFASASAACEGWQLMKYNTEIWFYCGTPSTSLSSRAQLRAAAGGEVAYVFALGQ